MDTKKMRACSYLLSDPGGEAVRKCLDEMHMLERRLKTLRELCGYVENGTDDAIVIGQDDATKTWHVYYATKPFKTIAWGESFNEMLDNAAKVLEHQNDG